MLERDIEAAKRRDLAVESSKSDDASYTSGGLSRMHAQTQITCVCCRIVSDKRTIEAGFPTAGRTRAILQQLRHSSDIDRDAHS